MVTLTVRLLQLIQFEKRGSRVLLGIDSALLYSKCLRSVVNIYSLSEFICYIDLCIYANSGLDIAATTSPLVTL